MNRSYLLLEGGGEFANEMAAADRAAINLAGGRDAAIAIIPAAAVPANDQAQAGANGTVWFRSLGQTTVRALALVNRDSAEDPRIAAELRSARLIFMLGGTPSYLAQTLRGSRAWQAALDAHEKGAVIGGSSAGAMVLCTDYFDPVREALSPGLGLLPSLCIIPHHDTFGKKWAPRISRLLPGALVLGIDEKTAVLNDGIGGSWTVYGRGVATVYGPGGPKAFGPGSQMELTGVSMSTEAPE